jgi:hypothetical protein
VAGLAEVWQDLSGHAAPMMRCGKAYKSRFWVILRVRQRTGT